MEQRTCSVDECESRHFGKGYCQKHYQRWRAHGDPLLGAAVRNPERCVIEGCEKGARAKSLCPMHYQRQRITGTTDFVPKPRKVRPKRIGVAQCSIEGCDEVVKAREWCKTHYDRWRKKGSPTARLRGEVRDGKRICPACGTDTPIADWYITPSGRFTKCRECFAEWNRNRGHSRRAPAEGPRFTRRQVLERDGFICQLCSKPIDADLKHPDPMSATLDHVIPLARGGVHSFANSQAAHRICNMRKWANVA